MAPHTLTVKLYDLASNELADVSPIVQEATVKPRHNLSRSFVFTGPAGHPYFTNLAGDGYPWLRKGNRKLVVWEDDVHDPLFHGRIQTVERVGSGRKNLVTVTAFDPLLELGYDPDRAGRVVRGSTLQPTAGDPFGAYDGNFINPKFASQVTDQAEISGPDLIQQILTNSQQTGAESDPSPGEGPLPIDLGAGDYDLDVPPAVDLSIVELMAWPKLCGDLIADLVNTGVVDVFLKPLHPDDATDPYHMVVLSAVSLFGTDRSGSVHFDYYTGDRNAKECRHFEDFGTINNKLYDYLGPPGPGGTRFPLGNITPGSPGTTVDPSASRALYGGPDGGQFMSIRITDWTGNPGDARPFAIALWNAEQGYRVEPRDLLFITPHSDSKGLYTAPQDFEIGDLVATNIGAALGIELAESQRVYGYDKTWNRNRVASLSQLITSADIA